MPNTTFLYGRAAIDEARRREEESVAVVVGGQLRNATARERFHGRAPYTGESDPFEAALGGDALIGRLHIFLVCDGSQGRGTARARGEACALACERMLEQMDRLATALEQPLGDGPLPEKLERLVTLVERRGLRCVP